MMQPPTIPTATQAQAPQQPATPGAVALPRQEVSVKSQIGTLVILCNDHIARYHEYMFADAGELVNELLMFRTDLENVYLNTNLYILQTKLGMEIPLEYKADSKTIGFLELCGDMEKWFTLEEYGGDPSPDNAFGDGEILCKLYQKALIIANLYNPAEV